MADSQGNSYIPMRVKITMFIIINVIGLSFLGAGSLFTNDPPAPFQSFGTGFGPAWLSGVDLTWEGSDLTFEMYRRYRRYRALAGEVERPEECRDQCGHGAICRDGVCVCDGGADERYVQLWGRCKSNHSMFSLVDNSDYKWRKPEAPVIPDYCYHMVRETYKEKSEGGKIVTKTKMVRRLDPAKQKIAAECVPVVYPDTFSLSDHRCSEADCHQWDINSVCGTAGRCVCREHMLWNADTLQCDLHLDLDCTNYLLYDFPDQLDIEIYEALRTDDSIEQTFDQERLKKAFCIYLDGKVDEYNLHRQKFPYEWSKGGYIITAFIFFGFGGFFYICGVLPMLCFYVKNEVHFCNPANAMRDITGQQ